MKQKSFLHSILLTAIGALMAASLSVQATPYATCLTNDGAGTVSFRLNQTTATNDTILVISGSGTVTNALQTPADDPANVVTRGLIVTNLSIAAGTFHVYIKHVGSGVISTNSPRVAGFFPGTANTGTLRGMAVNCNVGSPYFGWVYVANGATNATTGNYKGDGLFAYTSDIGSPTSDILGQGKVPRTGGYDFVTGGSATPYRCEVAPDDSVLVTDWADSSGGLIAFDPLLSSYSYVLGQIQGTAAAPVGLNNNHGSLSGAFIVGTGANRVLYTSDEDYQTDPATGVTTELNSIWRYDIGAGPLPWTSPPNRKIMTPFLPNFAGQNQKVQVAGHYLYAMQRRSNFPQHDVYVVDLNNLQDPSTFPGSATPWGHVWASQDESLAEGYSNDLLRDTFGIAVSPDGKWFAAINGGAGSAITTPDGVTYQNAANDIIVCPLTNGIPHLAARQVFKPGGQGVGRDVAFDAAHNLYFISSGLGVAQSLDLGESTEATTGSDGTFSLITPATQVSVSPATPVASEQGSAPGVFTITRTADDIGNPITVFYTISGSASNSVDYAILTNRVTIAAGQTSTNITVTPVDDSIAELSETVLLTIQGSGGYSVGFPLSATVFIADNETPQLRITGLSTNLYQANSNDYAAVQLQRWGDTNVALSLDASSFAMGGTAVSNVDYYLANLPLTIDAGVANYSNVLIKPIDASTAVGSKSILLTLLPGSGYTVTNNTATSWLQLKAAPPGTVLFSDNFETDAVGTNWNVFYGSLTNSAPDYAVAFDYDYGAGDFTKNLPPLPPAPNSTSGGTRGLYLTVNKGDSVGIPAGLNLYLKNHSFGSNYTLRFDMFLVQNSSSTTQSKNETALFGINHSGTKTNWVNNAVPGTGTDPKYDSDGIFCSLEADAGTTLNFAMWSGPTWTNTVAVVGPTNFLGRLASTTRQVFKKPPFDAGVLTASTLGGVPANTILNPTPTWVEVEVSQVWNGFTNVVTWKINNTEIFSYAHTRPTTLPYTNGTIMLGYDDPWADIGNSTAGSGEACVIYDNVRVVSLTPAAILAQPTSIVALAGTSTNLTVVASTVSGVTNYQWQRVGANGIGTNLVGATSSTLSFPALALTNYGTYRVIVNDGAYPVTSASVTVLPPAPSVTDPASKAVPFGLATSLLVVGNTYTGVTNYQWMMGTTNVAGANYGGITTATLNIGYMRATNAGPYKVRLSDGVTTITSAVANVTLALQPAVSSTLSGGTLTLGFPSEIGPDYVVEWKGELTNGVWNPLATNAGTGNPVNVPVSTTEPQQYFRVRMQ